MTDESLPPLRLRRFVPPVLASLVVLFLSVSIISGERGFFDRQRLAAEKHHLQNELSALRRANTTLQFQVHRLSDNSIDLDFLDERARLVLGLAAKNETVIFTPTTN